MDRFRPFVERFARALPRIVRGEEGNARKEKKKKKKGRMARLSWLFEIIT